MQLRRFSIILAASILVLPIYAQFNTYSPYTRFGLGDLSKNGFAQNLAMGGTGIAIHDGRRINYLNPASSAALDSTSVYFDFGANAFFNQYKYDNLLDPESAPVSNSWINVNFHHVAFASSMGKHLGLHAGIVPYSSIGYSIKQEYDNYDTGTPMDSYFSGNGGIMNFFVGTSAKFFDRLSLGVTMNFLMGKLSRERDVRFPTHPEYSNALSREDLDLRKAVFSFGLQYHEVIRDKFFFTLGGVYDPATSASISKHIQLVNSIYLYDPVYVDSVTLIDPEYSLISDTIREGFDIPRKIGAGIALGIPDKFTLTGDYYLQDWTGSLSGGGYQTTRASSIHVGAEYIPDHEALRGFHKLMTYRIGGYYSNSYLSVLKPGTGSGSAGDYYQLKDYGITFGAGIPVRTLRSSINVAFTLGTRGTTEYNLVKENYGIITFNVTLHDLWFRKRRFD